MIQILCQMVAQPEKAIVLGGTYRVPILEGLYPKTFVRDLRMDDTFNEASFEREYESRWAGAVEGAFYSPEVFDKNRKLLVPEWEYFRENKDNAGMFYVLGVDVGRLDCTTEVAVIKISHPESKLPIKKVVNFYSFDEAHFGAQSIQIKRLAKKYNARMTVVDANGLGIGLVDFLIVDQTDPDTGEMLPTLGVYNDDDGKYKQFATENTIPDSMYLIKANPAINTECYVYIQAQMRQGRLQFLIDENEAKSNLEDAEQRLTKTQREHHLRPYTLTSILEEQMMNLIQGEANDGINVILKPISKVIKKDRFSALCYGCWWCRQLEQNKHNGILKAENLTFYN